MAKIDIDKINTLYMKVIPSKSCITWARISNNKIYTYILLLLKTNLELKSKMLNIILK